MTNDLSRAKQDASFVVQQLCNLVVNEYNEGTEKRLGNISMSDLGGFERKIRYKLQSTPVTNVPPSVGSLHDGRMLHEDTQAMLSTIFGTQFHTVEETVIANFGEVEVRGHVDGVLRIGEKDYLFELKTFNDFGWRKRYDSFGPDTGYRAQLNGYLKALDLEYAIVIMRKKAFQEWDSMVLKYDEVVYKRTVDSLSKVRGELPLNRIEPDKKGNLHWMCNYCPYLQKCWGNEVVKASLNKWKRV